MANWFYVQPNADLVRMSGNGFKALGDSAIQTHLGLLGMQKHQSDLETAKKNRDLTQSQTDANNARTKLLGSQNEHQGLLNAYFERDKQNEYANAAANRTVMLANKNNIDSTTSLNNQKYELDAKNFNIAYPLAKETAQNALIEQQTQKAMNYIESDPNFQKYYQKWLIQNDYEPQTAEENQIHMETFKRLRAKQIEQESRGGYTPRLSELEASKKIRELEEQNKHLQAQIGAKKYNSTNYGTSLPNYPM